MILGLLWYDDDPNHDLAEKVKMAAKAYRCKFGDEPNTCYVHPLALAPRLPDAQAASAQTLVDNVEVAPLATVLRHHFWIGREDVNV